MGNIQSKFDELQPYVIGFRYDSGIPIVEVYLKKGWEAPGNDVFEKQLSDPKQNIYLFFTRKKGVGVDNILEYVEQIIDMNIENENKQILLKEKIKELNELFIENSLEDLNKLTFVIGNNRVDIPSNVNEIEEIKQPIITEKIDDKPSVELPPKTNVELETFNKPKPTVCNCGDDDFCDICMEEKGL